MTIWDNLMRAKILRISGQRADEILTQIIPSTPGHEISCFRQNHPKQVTYFCFANLFEPARSVAFSRVKNAAKFWNLQTFKCLLFFYLFVCAPLCKYPSFASTKSKGLDRFRKAPDSTEYIQFHCEGFQYQVSE